MKKSKKVFIATAVTGITLILAVAAVYAYLPADCILFK